MTIKRDFQNDKFDNLEIIKEASTELTISAGVVAVTLVQHSVDTEADAATDDLDTLGTSVAGQETFLTLENNARVVTLKHNTGDIQLPGGTDLAMSTDGVFHFISDGTDWRLNTGAGTGSGTDADAIHDNVASEISAVSAKTPLVAADLFLIEDSAAANVKKSATIADIPIGAILGTLAINKGGTGQTAQTAAFDALAPTTTKGDITVHDGSDNIRLAVGSDTQVLTADAAEASGTKWATPSATDADAIHDNVAGEITAVALKGTPVGADVVLIEDSADSDNKKRAALSTIPGIVDLTAVNSWTGQQTFAIATLTDAANISWNLNTQQIAKVTLGGNRQLDNPTNLVDGGTYIIRVIQDGTGTRTLSYDTAYRFPGGVAHVLSTGISSELVVASVTVVFVPNQP